MKETDPSLETFFLSELFRAEVQDMVFASDSYNGWMRDRQKAAAKNSAKEGSIETQTKVRKKAFLDDDLVRKYVSKGWSDRRIAYAFGCSAQAVANWRHRNGFKRRRSPMRSPSEPRVFFPAESVAEAVRLVEAGVSYTNAARAAGVSRNAVAGAVYRRRNKS